jgi:DUF971 family protein
MPMVPVSIRLKKRSAMLVLEYSDGSSCELSAEFLRVFSPSAEVRGHGRGNAVLQTGKRQVKMTGLDPVGSYGIKPLFDDGHQSGIYSWDYLYELCSRQDQLWQEYLQRLREAGASRDALPADTQVITIEPLVRTPARPSSD